MGLQEIVIIAIIGLLAGFVGGSLGVGGGIIIVPALVFLMGFTQHEAQGTYLAVLLFPIGILGVINYYKGGYVEFKYALILIIAFLAGSYLGSLMAVRLPDDVLRKIFGIFMLLVSIKMIAGK
jgi:uncharacterized membrane protein YfcA